MIDLSSHAPRADLRNENRGKIRFVHFLLSVVIGIEVLVLGVQVLVHISENQGVAPSPVATQPEQNVNVPEVRTDIMYSNRSHIWAIGFLPSGEMLFTERRGTFQIVSNGQTRELAYVRDVAAKGEGGLMGMVIDPQFATNRYVYACFNSDAGDVRVARWTLPADFSTLTQRKDIITGIPANPTGRHSGCAVAFAPDGYLYVGTGDSAQALSPQTPQDPKSLGGKILRVTRDGAAAPGNLAKPYDARMYSYGHRNTQGLAFFSAAREDGLVGVSAEHGPDVDDELNPVVQGNFGWAPNSTYDEVDVPMTDLARFPNAVEARWRTGTPTQAPAGITIINGKQWKSWDGAVAMAILKETHLKIIELGDTPEENQVTRLLKAGFGRIRCVTQGPDGNLYVGTSNGSDDKIIRVTPL